MNNSELTTVENKNEQEPFALVTCLISVAIIILLLFRVVIRIPVPFTDAQLPVYLAIIPILFVFFIIKNRFYISSISRLKCDKYSIIYWIPLFGIFWLIYGGIQLLIIDNNNPSSGMKEILYLGLGFMSVLCIFELMKKQNSLKYMVNTMLIIYSAVAIFSIFELLSGIHLSMSMLRDPDNIFNSFDRIYFMATGIFYNPNDLSTFLAFFFPLLFLLKDACMWKKIALHIVMCLSILVIMCNDSWIIMFSIVIAGIIACVIVRPKLLHIILYSVGFVLLCAFGPKVMMVINPNAVILSFDDFLLREQLGGGSLTIRANTYLYGLKSTFTETFGLGFGPSGFSSVHDIYAEKVLLNPHSLVVEIISQYGIIIFALFALFYFCILINLLKLYKISKDSKCLMIIMIFIFYPMVTFSPSAFLTASYQWIPIAWGIYFVWNSKDQLKNNEEIVKEKLK